MLTRTVIAALFAAVLPALAAAQESHAFTIPRADDLTCTRHEIPDSLRNVMGATVFNFRTGPRWIYASYDTAGGPVSLTDGDFSRDSSGGRIADVRTVMFHSSSEDIGFRRRSVVGDDAASASPQLPHAPPTMPEPISPDDKSRARALASWLWTRRCR